MEFRGEPELLCAFEFDGIDECDTRPVGDPEELSVLVSKDVDVSDIILD
jgi:hypothetical protein